MSAEHLLVRHVIYLHLCPVIDRLLFIRFLLTVSIVCYFKNVVKVRMEKSCGTYFRHEIRSQWTK